MYANKELEDLNVAASALAKLILSLPDTHIVFAESCTAGLVAASLAGTPGISRHLCGSAVTYRPITKSDWLGVSAELIEKHTAESLVVAQSMAKCVLAKTPEAQWSAAITGHLGPNSPLESDGMIFVSVAKRSPEEIELVTSSTRKLETLHRIPRQQAAATVVLEELRRAIEMR